MSKRGVVKAQRSAKQVQVKKVNVHSQPLSTKSKQHEDMTSHSSSPEKSSGRRKSNGLGSLEGAYVTLIPSPRSKALAERTYRQQRRELTKLYMELGWME